MEQTEEKKKRGGFREGAGRKPTDGIGMQHVGLRLRKDYVAIIDKNFKNRSEFINQAVREKLIRGRLL